MSQEKESKAEPFALDLSEAQVLWEQYTQKFNIKPHMSQPNTPEHAPNLHGAWLDGFLHARGWRLNSDKVHEYTKERAYELHPHALNELEEIRSILNVVYDPKAMVEGVRELRNKLHAATHALKSITQVEEQPVPMLLWCPDCGQRHIDVGVFETKLHHTHACQHCGMVWRPAICNTKGVWFLPGFKND
jgi:predicted RNA-binding Zn-ribbon protein involved in translation (DUF1610 family)